MALALARAATIAAIVWGTVPGCHPVHQKFEALPRSALGEANSPCTILYNRRRHYDWPHLCATTIHEWGHLVGRNHVTNPSSIMFSHYHGDSRCRNNGKPYIQAHPARDPNKQLALVTWLRFQVPFL